MIDFRYHLISLIAVFLALGLGILMGSVVLSEKYVNRLENRVETFEGEVDERRREVTLLNDRIDALQEFALQSQPRLIDGALAGEKVVAFEIHGTDEVLLEGITDVIRQSGGTVVSTITLTDRFMLTDQPERDQLALILGSVSGEGRALRDEAGRLLGQRAAVAASTPVEDRRRGASPATQRLVDLIEQLEEAEFVGISTTEELPVPAGASFVVAAGSSEPSRGGARDLALALAGGIANGEGSAILTEPVGSSWELASTLRDDGSLSAVVASADHADTVPGRISVVLGLDLVLDGVVGHYGTGDGASEIVPPPTPRA
ncbi:MAG TPA: copper transporter [Actinomycetota bacterium]|nr:copper transporter [Actinomycetota bacterium]